MTAIEAAELDLQNSWNMYNATCRLIARLEDEGSDTTNARRQLSTWGVRINATRAAIGYILGCCTYQNLCADHNGTSDLAKHSNGDKALAGRLLYGDPVSARR